MVHDLVVTADLRVLVAQRVEAVRAGDDDLLGADLVERLDVLLREHLEQELVARTARGVTGAGLTLAEHGERDAGHVQQLGDRLRRLLRAVLERTGAADPEQVLGVVVERALDDLHLERQVGGPVEPRRRVHAPRVALGLEVLEQTTELGGELRLDQHLEAAHVGDVVDVLDVDRALLDAGTARRARPEDVGVDDAAADAVTVVVVLGGADERTRRGVLHRLREVGELDGHRGGGPPVEAR